MEEKDNTFWALMMGGFLLFTTTEIIAWLLFR